ncbi:M1 family aminopeptidase [Saccharothrix xinjiangensis]|uniref:M1 family aminopeptidase n=1 Tax=Saccharothrix xinjiangensis TaxID=204798 RepID=A0ABV9XX72_9PSEU
MITLVEVEAYDLTWRLDPAADGVRGRTTLRFRGEPEPVEVFGEVLVPPQREDGGLRVEALFPYARPGFRRVTDPVDGQVYLYAAPNPHGTPRCLGHFADHQLRAPVTLTAVVPPTWKCLANGLPLVDGGEVRTFAPTAPTEPAWVALAAGPFVEVAPSVHVPRSRAGVDGTRVADLVARSTAFFADLLAPNPYPKCELVFVHDLSLLALSTQGLIVFDEGALDRFVDPRYATTVIAHEVAHQWSGNLVNTETWLVEGLAVYLSRLFAEVERPDDDVWGDPPPPDRPYKPHLDRVLEVEARVGREGLLRGLRSVFAERAHRYVAPDGFQARWT